MYYDNKRTFYVKQYGPAVLVSVLALVLVSTGSVYYLAKSNNADENIVASNPTEVVVQEPVEETSALQEVEVVPYFENLETLIISEEVDVASVDNNGVISLDKAGDKISVSMIGIDYKYSSVDTFNKIRSDLEGKKVKIAFDTQKEVNGMIYAYVYLNDDLYNEVILKSGLATLKSERVNVAQATKLSQAQAYARQNKQGVWNK